MTRDEMAAKLEQIGTEANALRQEMANADYGFCVGLVRAAEEALQVAYNALKDPNVGDGEL